MRILVLVLFFVIAVPVAFAAEGEKAFNIVGAGAIVSASPYAGVDAKTMGIPFLALEHKGFYLQGVEAGYRFFRKEGWALSAVIGPRFMGYDADDSAALNGMCDRRMSMDAGLKAERGLAGNWTVSAKVMADVLSRSDGMEYELALRYPMKGRIFRLIPSAGVRYQSESMVDYYYGVRDDEARAGRAAYQPRGALNPFANLVFTCGLSRKLAVTTMLGVTSLGSEIRKSPIVDESYVWSAAAGVTYRF